MLITFILLLVIGGVVAFFVHKDSNKNKAGAGNKCSQSGGADGKPVCKDDGSGELELGIVGVDPDTLVNSDGTTLPSDTEITVDTISYEIVGISNPGVFDQQAQFTGITNFYERALRDARDEAQDSFNVNDRTSPDTINSKVHWQLGGCTSCPGPKYCCGDVLDDYIYVFFKTPGHYVRNNNPSDDVEHLDDMAIQVPGTNTNPLVLTINNRNGTDPVHLNPSYIRIANGYGDFNKTGYESFLSDGNLTTDLPGANAIQWPYPNGIPSSFTDNYAPRKLNPDIQWLQGRYEVNPDLRMNTEDTESPNGCGGTGSSSAVLIPKPEVTHTVKVTKLEFTSGQKEVIIQYYAATDVSRNWAFAQGQTIQLLLPTGTYGGVSSKTLNTKHNLSTTGGGGSIPPKGPYLRFDLEAEASTTETIVFKGGSLSAGENDSRSKVASAYVFMVGNQNHGVRDLLRRWNVCTSPFTGVNRGCAGTISELSKQNYIKIPINERFRKESLEPFVALAAFAACSGTVFPVVSNSLEILVQRGSIRQ